MKKKCITCGEVKPLTDFHNRYKDGRLINECKICKNERSLRNARKLWNTEIGFLAYKYSGIKAREKEHKGMSHRCWFTFKEFCGAFEEHKEKLGMRSAWGPHHLPITMIYQGRGRGPKGQRNCGSNLSPDRLDSSKPYTIQNLIFIRSDENLRKKDTTYEDCLTQIKLHEERFMKDKKSTSGDITSPKM